MKIPYERIVKLTKLSVEAKRKLPGSQFSTMKNPQDLFKYMIEVTLNMDEALRLEKMSAFGKVGSYQKQNKFRYHSVSKSMIDTGESPRRNKSP